MHSKWLLGLFFLWLCSAVAGETVLEQTNRMMLRPDIRKMQSENKDAGALEKAISQRAFVSAESYQCDSILEGDKGVACHLIELGDAAARQDMGVWAEKYRIFKQAIARHELSLGKWADYFKKLDGQSLEQLSRVAPLEVVGAPTVFLSYTASGPQMFDEQLRPILTDAQGNKWLVDSGASQTLINTEVAKKLNARPLSGVQAELTSYHSDGKEQSPLAVIDRLDFNGLSLKNVMVYIYSGNSIIGLDLLKKVGSVNLTSNGLYRLSAPDFDIRFGKCKAAVYLGSNIFNTTQFLFVGASVEGKKQYALVDTGVAGYVRRKAVADENTVKILDDGKDSLNSSMGYYTQKTVPITIADVNKEVTVMDVVNADYPAPDILGFGLLDDFDLLMDYRSKRACLSERFER